ncbi:MAG TPA: hypothetical protein VI977_02510 [archaeon]|nr:hypothetical protein [archaeon]
MAFFTRKRGVLHSISNGFRRREKISALKEEIESLDKTRLFFEIQRDYLLGMLETPAAKEHTDYRKIVGNAQAVAASKIIDLNAKVARCRKQIARLQKLGKRK